MLYTGAYTSNVTLKWDYVLFYDWYKEDLYKDYGMGSYRSSYQWSFGLERLLDLYLTNETMQDERARVEKTFLPEGMEMTTAFNILHEYNIKYKKEYHIIHPTEYFNKIVVACFIMFWIYVIYIALDLNFTPTKTAEEEWQERFENELKTPADGWLQA